MRDRERWEMPHAQAGGRGPKPLTDPMGQRTKLREAQGSNSRVGRELPAEDLDARPASFHVAKGQI